MGHPELDQRNIAGTTGLYLDNWEKLTSDRAILQNVAGIRLEFEEQPFQQAVPRQYNCSSEQAIFINQEVSDLLDKGVVVRVSDSSGCFISNVFLRPKPNNKWRLIIDLSDLNVFITKQHFKMEHLDVASRLMFPEAWMASIDLKDAYYTLPIHPMDRKYLCFQWDNQVYMFTCLPFGLSSAPFLFTKTLRPIFSKFHELGHEGFGYIDDSFIISESFEKCQEAVNDLTNLFKELGFRINGEKSITQPTRKLTFLGFVLDTNDMSISPTHDKIEKVLKKIESLESKPNPKIREVASMCGSLNDLCKGSEYGLAHVKSLEIQKNRALSQVGSQGFEAKMKLNRFCHDNLHWWSNNLSSAKKLIRIIPPKETLTTDASSLGWGACFNDLSTGGRWSQQESEFHINILELKAVWLGLNALCKDIFAQGLKIRSDNTTAVSYIAHGGGTHSTECNEIAGQIWKWCQERRIWLIVSHVPGVLNSQADYESRHFSEDTEWEINPQIFHNICQQWGTPDIDLFASRLNHQVSQYASWGPDPFCSFVDAFTEDWSQFNLVYIFPPFRLINRVLQKVRSEKVMAIIIAPNWMGQPWFTPLQKMSSAILHFPRKFGNLRQQGLQVDNSLHDIPINAHLVC